MASYLTQSLIWLGAISVALLPGIVALDSGGVFTWSWWAIAIGVTFPTICTLFAIRARNGARQLQAIALPLLLLLFAAFAAFQIVSLPAELINWLSSGSYAAWTEWSTDLTSAIDDSEGGGALTISIAPWRTQQYIWMFSTLAAFAWCGANLFHSRGRVLWLLTCIATMSSLHTLLGFWQIAASPDQTLWGSEASGPFGVFINRNNASAILNIGLACSLGLIAWRLAIVTGFEFGQPHFHFSAILDLFSDRAATVAIVNTVITLAGLLACGSRGGLLGCIVGVVLGLGLYKSMHIVQKLVTSILLAVLVATVLLVHLDLTPRSMERLGASGKGLSESIVNDGRLPHWQDSISAAGHYLPCGAGFGTYRYAYLPYQHTGSIKWFLNADNLLLEWVLEGGLITILLIFGLGSVIIFSLLQLRDTPDPIDHGIATAGWVAFGALMVNALFDFGLLLAGAAALTALLFGCVVGRAASHGATSIIQGTKGKVLKSQSKLDYLNNLKIWLAMLVPVTIFIALPLSIIKLKQRAIEESVYLHAQLIDTLSTEEIDQTRTALSSIINQGTQNYEIFQLNAFLTGLQLEQNVADQLANIQLLQTAGYARDKNPYSLVRKLDRFANSKDGDIPNETRELLRLQIAALQSQVESSYNQLLKSCDASLEQCPLSSETRFIALLNDPGLLEDGIAQEIIKRILILRQGATGSLLVLARHASDNQDWETVNQALQDSLLSNPARTKVILREARMMGHPNPLQIVPMRPEEVSLAVEYALESNLSNVSFFKQALRILSEEYPEDRISRADRLLLVAKLQARLGNDELASEKYLEAIRVLPTSLPTRIEYINFLMSQGELTLAKRYAEGLRSTFGDANTTLEAAIRKIK